MKKIILGRTGIEVTELCFGVLPIGPLQKNLPAELAAAVLAEAFKLGITFIDTAQMYLTYEPIRTAIRQTGIRPVISTKSAAETYEDMAFAVKEALSAMDVDYIDIFLLHAARADANVFDERKGALECLLDYREKGVIKAAGISSHSVDVVEAAAQNPNIDVVFPILNKKGMGILRGNKDGMEAAIEGCFTQNKGVFFMKALAGGTLINDYFAALDYCRSFSENRAPIAVGMVSVDEVVMNVKYFNGEDVGNMASVNAPVKNFMVSGFLCAKCGACVDACHSGAITVSEDRPASIDSSVCLKCGYCVAACKEFAIRMV